MYSKPNRTTPCAQWRALSFACRVLPLLLCAPAVGGELTDNPRGSGVGPAATTADNLWTPLFNGQNLDGWYTWLPSTGINNDPKGVFKVHDGMLHILDIPLTGQEQEFGYVSTQSEYANYRLR